MAPSAETLWFRGQRQTPTEAGLPEFYFAGKSVLDVGCGTGKDLLHPVFAEAAERCGIDVDEELIRYGQRNYPALKLSVGQAEALPYTDAQFDAVISRGSLIFTDLPVALAEISRVIRRGGSLLLTTHDLRHQLHWWATAALRLEWKRILDIPYVIVASVVSGLGYHVPRRPWNGRRLTFHSRLFLRGPLTKAGFSNIGFERTRTHFIVRATKS